LYYCGSVVGDRCAFVEAAGMQSEETTVLSVTMEDNGTMEAAGCNPKKQGFSKRRPAISLHTNIRLPSILTFSFPHAWESKFE
jgi:hypothetical protein